MIDPRIQYANEPGFTHVQRPSQSNDEFIKSDEFIKHIY